MLSKHQQSRQLNPQKSPRAFEYNHAPTSGHGKLLVDVGRRSAHTPDALSYNDVVTLQGTIGNGTVGKVMRQYSSTSSSATLNPRVASIQSKPMVRKTNDQGEQEAVRLAEPPIIKAHSPSPRVQSQTNQDIEQENHGPLQGKSIAPSVQRQKRREQEELVQLQPQHRLRVAAGQSRRTRDRSPAADAVTDEQIRLRQDLHILLNIYENRILGRIDDWLVAAQNVGSAYATAAATHQEAVTSRARQQALREAALYGVLTAVCTGGLGWLAGPAHAALKPILDLEKEAFENVQDTLVVMVSEGIDVYQASTQPQPQPVSRSPLVYQNQITSRILRERQGVHVQFERWLEVLLDAPMSAYGNRASLQSLRRLIESWTQTSSQLAGGAGLPNIQTMAMTLERGFWAEWIPRNLISRRSSVMRTGELVEHTEYESPGTAVEARFNALGITSDSGVNDFGWWTSDTEVQQLIAWARQFRPQPFIP